MRAALPLLLAVAAAAPSHAQGPQLPPEETFMRTAHAARRVGSSIEIDGKMDEAAWQRVPLEENFRQVAPDEGKPASVRTAFRVLWDDEYLYFGAICDDPEEPTISLSRRDRYIEGDTIQFDLDTTLDRRTAYHFQVYAAGQQLDAIHFNDTDMTTDWDAAWDSAVARTPTGWSVEMRIPLRSLRIPEGAKVMGFNVYRVLSRRKEEDQWRYRPNGRPGDISRLGLLEGIEGIHPVRELELRPYLGMKYLRTSPTYAKGRAELGSCGTTAFDAERSGGLCAGLDLRYNIASDLALVGTINPDFGQVEADARTLNLSTFETFFPEKRPFFLEGLDLFKLPLRTDIGGPYGGDAYQIFYSRRIGRGSPSADDLGLSDDQHLVYEQPSIPVATAMKVSGTLGGASVGLLTAIEPRVSAQVLDTDGKIKDFAAVEARHDAVLRMRKNLGDNAMVGGTFTSVDPIFTDGALISQRHAHVGEGDLSLYSTDRAWDFTVQGLGSQLSGNVPGTLRDGTFVGASGSGWAASTRIRHSEEYWGSALNLDHMSPKFTVNDLGFMQRANLNRAMGYVFLRDPHANSVWQNSQLLVGGRAVGDSALDHRLAADAFLEASMTDKSFWFWDTGVDFFASAVDDREMEDGTPIERQGFGYWYGFISTDSRKPLQLQLSWTQGRAWPRFERTNQLEFFFVVRPLPQLDGSLDLAYSETSGTIRQIRTAGPVPENGGDPTATFPRTGATDLTRLYLLAPQQARSVSATLRATYSFTPYLTLQAYAQLFTAGVAYGGAQRVVVPPGRSTIKLNDLSPALPEDQAPNADDRQAGLNVNLILRWEWKTGSTFYLVYAHQSSNDITPPDHGLDLGAELGTLQKAGVTHGDTILVKIDLLSAF